MATGIVFTLTGPDRVGIVEEVTKALLDLGANVEMSRMARLGGEFAVLLLATAPDGGADIDAAFAHLTDAGYKLTVTTTEPSAVRPGGLPYRIEVTGADHEGIIHEIAFGLSQAGINIESMETGTTPASVTGTPLFAMKALVAVPQSVADTDWIGALTEAANQSNVDVTIVAADAV